MQIQLAAMQQFMAGLLCSLLVSLALSQSQDNDDSAVLIADEVIFT